MGDLISLHDVLVRNATRKRLAQDEAVIRGLLGRWISETEPSVCRRQGTFEILGLTVEGDPTGTISVLCEPTVKP